MYLKRINYGIVLSAWQHEWYKLEEEIHANTNVCSQNFYYLHALMHVFQDEF